MASTKAKGARPFLKWAGGKRGLLDKILPFFPETIRTYYEPFFGGGALFFHLATEQRFEHAVLNDVNPDLITTYKIVRDFPDELVRGLQGLTVDKDTYMMLRGYDPEDLDPVARAIRFIYLNKTCFNGLWRVNKQGKFNVPYGDPKGERWVQKPPLVYKEETIHACSRELNRWAQIHLGDFWEICEWPRPGDLVYFDPPYVPLSPTSNFSDGYTQGGFTLDDQSRLVAACRRLVERGVTVVASNSDCELVRRLYAGFELHEIQARRAINSKGDRRGPVGELVIVGRPE